jgi:uncharacterized protein YbaR (Trm112 family)
VGWVVVFVLAQGGFFSVKIPIFGEVVILIIAVSVLLRSERHPEAEIGRVPEFSAIMEDLDLGGEQIGKLKILDSGEDGGEARLDVVFCISYNSETECCALMEILVCNLCNRHLKAVADAFDDTADDLPFPFEGAIAEEVQAELADPNDHSAYPSSLVSISSSS